MTQTKIPVISISGDPYQCGYQYGSMAAEAIRFNIRWYLQRWQTDLNLDRNQVLDLASKFFHAVASFDSRILEEMEGIAAGARVSLEEVLAINARYEFIWAGSRICEDSLRCPVAECTSLGAASEATANGHTLIGQNWDYAVGHGQWCVIVEVCQSGRPNLVFHAEAGTVGHKGLNSRGIGLCMTALLSANDRFQPKVPFLVLCRGLLNCRSLEEVVDTAERTSCSVSGSCLVGNGQGRIINLEITPADVGIVEPRNGRLAHGNIFLDLRTERKIHDHFKEIYPQLCLRSSQAHDLLDEISPSLERLQEIFSDHANAPESICRHLEDQGPAPIADETVVSVIMDLTARVFYISSGPPCKNPYRRLSFPSLMDFSELMSIV